MMRRGGFGVLVLVLTLGALVSSAAATGTPVKQAIEAQLKRIQANPEFKSLKTFKIGNTAEAQKAIPKIEAIKAVLHQRCCGGREFLRDDHGRTDRAEGLGVRGQAEHHRRQRSRHRPEGLCERQQDHKLRRRSTRASSSGASANEESLKAYKLLGISASS